MRSSPITRPDALAKVVDKLLESPHYGEKWARHWLDVARYAEDNPHLRREAEDASLALPRLGDRRLQR